MERLPQAVKDRMVKLNEEFNLHLTAVKSKNQIYYIYGSTSVWDGTTGRSRKVTRYFGKVDIYGKFFGKKQNKGFLSYIENLLPPNVKRELKRLRGIYPSAFIEKIEGNIFYISIVEKYGITHIGKLTEDGDFIAKPENMPIGDVEQKILMCLSMNARIPISKVAKIVGISEQAAHYKIKRLEEKFGINYILEINIKKLGYMPWLIFGKFEEKGPSSEELKLLFEKEPSIQFVALMKGEYDLLIYILGKDPVQMMDDFWLFKARTTLGKYRIRWYTTVLAQVYSHIPLRDEFLAFLLQEKTNNLKEVTSKHKELSYNTLAIIKDLNKDSIRDFTELDRSHKLKRGSSRYLYQKAISEGLITRSTVTLTKLNIKYLGVLIEDTVNVDKTFKNWHKLLNMLTQYGQITNMFAFGCNIGFNDASVLLLPFFDEMELEHLGKEVEELTEGGILARYAIITKVLVGSLCFRRFDNTYSRQYHLIKEMGKAEPRKLVDYE